MSSDAEIRDERVGEGVAMIRPSQIVRPSQLISDLPYDDTNFQDLFHKFVRQLVHEHDRQVAILKGEISRQQLVNDELMNTSTRASTVPATAPLPRPKLPDNFMSAKPACTVASPTKRANPGKTFSSLCPDNDQHVRDEKEFAHAFSDDDKKQIEMESSREHVSLQTPRRAPIPARFPASRDDSAEMRAPIPGPGQEDVDGEAHSGDGRHSSGPAPLRADLHEQLMKRIEARRMEYVLRTKRENPTGSASSPTDDAKDWDRVVAWAANLRETSEAQERDSAGGLGGSIARDEGAWRDLEVAVDVASPGELERLMSLVQARRGSSNYEGSSAPSVANPATSGADPTPEQRHLGSRPSVANPANSEADPTPEQRHLGSRPSPWTPRTSGNRQCSMFRDCSGSRRKDPAEVLGIVEKRPVSTERKKDSLGEDAWDSWQKGVAKAAVGMVERVKPSRKTS